jgi:hypothetical protein
MAVGVVLVLALSLFGQVYYGSISGTITDSSGAVIPGATVMLTNVATGVQQEMKTAGTGNYAFFNLDVGTYRVDVTASGFEKATSTAQVTVSAAVLVNISMQVGMATQTVEVSAAAAALQTVNANLTTVTSPQLVSDLPLDARNIMNLLQFTPGVVPEAQTEGVSITGKNIFAAGNYQIGGGMSNQSGVYYDGVPANGALGNMTVFVPDPDTVAEFSVQTNSNNAQYGRYSGGIINITSKSGTNQFHGNAYEYFRSTGLNANTFFGNEAGLARTPFHLNQFGGSIGGPIEKNKMFFFFNYERLHELDGYTVTSTVPTAAELGGDFSGYTDSNGVQIPIYNPLTQCGTGSNPACTPGQVVQRQQFTYNNVLNVIPPSMIDPVAAKMLAFPLMSPPNSPGLPGGLNNYNTTCDTGGDNNQENARWDYDISSKLRLFARYSRWKSAAVPCIPFNNTIYANNASDPEEFTTQQSVLGVTYTMSPTLVLDLRLSYIRFPYDRANPDTGISLSGKFGFPSYMDTDLPLIHSGPSTSVPAMEYSDPYYMAGLETGLDIRSVEDDYLLVPNLAWVKGRHTFQFGAYVEQMMNTYYQTFDGGEFNFDNLYTSQNALNPGSTGNSLASMLLGIGSSGDETAFARPWEHLLYQGYYGQDTWQATKKLTVTYGLRWEIPGVWTEEHNRVATFNPGELNPIASGITVNGGPVYGALDFANTSQMPGRGVNKEDFHLFAPRLGVAYRLNDKTVVRAGGGVYYIPTDTVFADEPWSYSTAQTNTSWVPSLNGEVTGLNPLSNPYPSGFLEAPANLPHAQQQAVMLGAGISQPLYKVPFPSMNQWNVAVQHELSSNMSFQIAYAGATGVHLPWFWWNGDTPPTQDLSLGPALQSQVTNPFYGLVTTGPLSSPQVAQEQLLLPYPEYNGWNENSTYGATSTYNALQTSFEKRFKDGGLIQIAYTFSKLLTNTSSMTGWLNSTAPGGIVTQNPNDMYGEKALAPFDVHQRATVAYSLNLPFGRGERWGNGGNRFVRELISGWKASGSATFQEGLPLALGTGGVASGYDYNPRPNVVPGCNKHMSGSAESRLDEWFNTACFTVPAPYTLGGESATDSTLRSDGIANFDFSLSKMTHITERVGLQFRADAFNLFNTPQFSWPGQSESSAPPSVSGFGIVNTQYNNPRLIQLALRLSF